MKASNSLFLQGFDCSQWLKHQLQYTHLAMQHLLGLIYFLPRYTYGKAVDGVAYIRFGIIDQQKTKTYLPGLEIQSPVCFTLTFCIAFSSWHSCAVYVQKLHYTTYNIHNIQYFRL